MTHILPADPSAPRFQYTFALEAVAIDKIRGDRTFRRTRLAAPLVRELQKSGYEVADPRTVLQAMSVTVKDTTGDGTVKVIAVVPRAPLVPANELNPEAAITVEYIGGEDDGKVEPLRMDPLIPPNLGIALNGSVYTRTAYNLATGVWLYQVERNEPTGAVEVDDDEVWAPDHEED